jgi:hypothetical protein
VTIVDHFNVRHTTFVRTMDWAPLGLWAPKTGASPPWRLAEKIV